MPADIYMNHEKLSLRIILRTLKYRNYRLFFAGQGISLIGTWMQTVAMSWLVYRLTNSVVLLGVVGFVSQLPAFPLAPFAGLLVDRKNRRKILIATQSLAMLQAVILAVLVFTGSIAVWHIILLGLFLGFINSLDMPARQSFVVEMIEKREDLGNAIALNSAMFNGARLIGPSIAGVLIAAVGEGWCFFINGVSYLAVIAALLAMKIATKKNIKKNNNAIDDLKEGFNYAFGFPPIRAILMLLGAVSLIGFPYVVLMPVFARDILHGGPHTLGFLMAAAGFGALSGALYLASRKNVLGLGKIIPSATTIFGLGLIGFSFSRIIGLSLFLMVVAGFGMMVQMASCNTFIQTIVDDDKRGRVMSLYVMAFMGTAPFGSLLAGTIAGKIGAPNMLLIGGLFCILGAQVFLRNLDNVRKFVKPIYIRKGIISETVSGIGTTTELTEISEI